MLTWAHPNPQPKLHLNRFSRFCTDHSRVLLYFTTDRHFPPLKLPLPLGDLHPHLTRDTLGPPQPTNGISNGSVIFAGLSTVVDRPCYSVDNNLGHIYVHSTAMRPNNNNIMIATSPMWETTTWYSCAIGSPNTAPFSLSSGNALFIRPPNLPLLRTRSPVRVRIVGQWVNFTICTQRDQLLHRTYRPAAQSQPQVVVICKWVDGLIHSLANWDSCPTPAKSEAIEYLQVGPT